MKALRALLLVLALSVSTFAGDIPYDKNGNMPFGKDGNIPFDKAGDIPFGKAGANALPTEIALYLLQSVLPLF